MWINGARVPLGNLEHVILVAIKEIDVEGQALALSGAGSDSWLAVPTYQLGHLASRNLRSLICQWENVTGSLAPMRGSEEFSEVRGVQGCAGQVLRHL